MINNNTIEVNADEVEAMREKLMKCKIIALDAMDKHPLINPKNLSTKDKEILKKRVRELFDKDLDELTKDFNEVCQLRLFDSGCDYTNYCTYVDKRFSNQQKIYERAEQEVDYTPIKVMDIAGNEIIIDSSIKNV